MFWLRLLLSFHLCLIAYGQTSTYSFIAWYYWEAAKKNFKNVGFRFPFYSDHDGHDHDCSKCPTNRYLLPNKCKPDKDKLIELNNYKIFVQNLLNRSNLEYSEDTKQYYRTVTLGSLSEEELLVLEKSDNSYNAAEISNTILIKILENIKTSKHKDNIDEDLDHSDIYENTWQSMKTKLLKLIKLKTKEEVFTFWVIIVLVLIWILHRIYNRNIILLLLVVGFAFGYLVTYYDCNREMETEEYVEFIKSEPDQESDKFFSFFPFNWFEKTAKEKIIDNISPGIKSFHSKSNQQDQRKATIDPAPISEDRLSGENLNILLEAIANGKMEREPSSHNHHHHHGGGGGNHYHSNSSNSCDHGRNFDCNNRNRGSGNGGGRGNCRHTYNRPPRFMKKNNQLSSMDGNNGGDHHHPPPQQQQQQWRSTSGNNASTMSSSYHEDESYATTVNNGGTTNDSHSRSSSRARTLPRPPKTNYNDKNNRRSQSRIYNNKMYNNDRGYKNNSLRHHGKHFNNNDNNQQEQQQHYRPQQSRNFNHRNPRYSSQSSLASETSSTLDRRHLRRNYVRNNNQQHHQQHQHQQPDNNATTHDWEDTHSLHGQPEESNWNSKDNNRELVLNARNTTKYMNYLSQK